MKNNMPVIANSKNFKYSSDLLERLKCYWNLKFCWTLSVMSYKIFPEHLYSSKYNQYKKHINSEKDTWKIGLINLMFFQSIN